MSCLFLFPCASLALSLAGCRSKPPSSPTPGAPLRQEQAEPELDERRLLFAQIVEDSEPDVFRESAILEGSPYKWLLRSLARVSHDQLRKSTSEELTFDNLMTQPGLYRGQVVTLPRGVVLEVSCADLPPEYGLPPGCTVLPAVFVDAARDVYALRILCPPRSKLFEKLDRGIRDDALPVLRITGCFMKLYARRTADPKEAPWRRPLLICPEPEFSQAAEPRKVWDELRETKADRFLPSERLEAPGAEERLVLELLGGGLRADGQHLRGETNASIAQAVRAFRTRLPPEQAGQPAAVVLIAPGADRSRADEVVAALRAAGVARIAIKAER